MEAEEQNDSLSCLSLGSIWSGLSADEGMAMTAAAEAINSSLGSEFKPMAVGDGPPPTSVSHRMTLPLPESEDANSEWERWTEEQRNSLLMKPPNDPKTDLTCDSLPGSGSEAEFPASDLPSISSSDPLIQSAECSGPASPSFIPPLEMQTPIKCKRPEASTVLNAIDEDSAESVGSSLSSNRARQRRPNKEMTTPVPTSTPVNDIFEYQWPPVTGEFYVLQEQISEFLGIKSFKRKYPDLKRRAVEIEERMFLKEQGVVTETQCDLGLTAAKSDDIMELMSKDYPEKYAEYMTLLDNKHQINSINIHKGYQTPSVEKSKMGEFIKRAMKSTTKYNQRLNRVRKEERNVCMDLQTYLTHYPIGLGLENKQLKRHSERHPRKTGRYPVALLPRQHQEWFLDYTPEELKYLPVNTVLYGPVVSDPSKLPPLLHSAEGSPEGSDDESVASEDGSSCSSASDFETKKMKVSDGNCGDKDMKLGCETANKANKGCEKMSDNRGDHSDSSSSSSDSDAESPPPPTLIRISEPVDRKPSPLCKLCHTRKHEEELIHCSECRSSAHPSCLELTQEMVIVIKSYAWQCMDCKSCTQCNKQNNEEKMMFCDRCDRGYHTFCVGLKHLPLGKWVCRLCAKCAQCGTTTPGTGPAAQWQHETIKITISPNSDTLRRHQLFCTTCYKLRKQRKIS